MNKEKREVKNINYLLICSGIQNKETIGKYPIVSLLSLKNTYIGQRNQS